MLRKSSLSTFELPKVGGIDAQKVPDALLVVDGPLLHPGAAAVVQPDVLFVLAEAVSLISVLALVRQVVEGLHVKRRQMLAHIAVEHRRAAASHPRRTRAVTRSQCR